MEDDNTTNEGQPTAQPNLVYEAIKLAMAEVMAAQPKTDATPQITHITPNAAGVYRPTAEQFAGLKNGTVKIQANG